MQGETGNKELIAFIRGQIRETGPVTFRWFMEQALYHPDWGYYARPNQPPVGKRGDFITNVSVGATFGKLIARQFYEMWCQMGKPFRFAIVEQAANDGHFACDVLDHLEANYPDFFAELSYTILEPIPHLELAQRRLLEPRFGSRLRWVRDFTELGAASFVGVFFCNELLDSFPIHLVLFRNEAWFEAYVTDHDGRFQLTQGPISHDSLRRQLAVIGPGQPGQIAEVNLRALSWIQDVAEALRSGYLFAIDYGLPRRELYDRSRMTGTLRCYRNHRAARDPFCEIGETDITAHVDFTSLAEAGEQAGMETICFCDQHHFMVGAATGFFDQMDSLQTSPTPAMQNELRQFQALMHPSTMGMSFRFFLMCKAVNNGGALSGLRYAPPPRPALGLE